LAEILLKGLGMYYTGIKVCGISKFSKSVLRSGVQHSCVVKLHDKKQVVICGPSATTQVQEKSTVMFSDIAVNQNKLTILKWILKKQLRSVGARLIWFRIWKW
jgi:hypothetical protein